MRPRRDGFSLIELLIVLSILGLLAGLALSALQSARQAAAAARCQHQLRQLALGCHNCQATHGRMPPAVGWFPQFKLQDGAGIGPLFFHLLPFTEGHSLYQGARQRDAGRDYYDHQRVGNQQIALFNCPSDPTLPPEGGSPAVKPYAGSSYAANALIFANVDADYQYVNGRGKPSLAALLCRRHQQHHPLCRKIRPGRDARGLDRRLPLGLLGPPQSHCLFRPVCPA